MIARDARILDVGPDEYHQLPGLSASIATTLITRSPLHAHAEHPSYGARGKAPTKAMDRGSVCHRLALGVGKEFEVLDFGDYRTKAAQTARDAARARGLVPILREDYDEAAAIAARVVAELGRRGIVFDGRSELALGWTEDTGGDGPVECRGMLDHLRADQRTIIDLKFVASAAPASVERSAESFGYAIQRAAYVRALSALRPELAGRVDFLFVFAEVDEPYAINVCRGDGAFRELGERRWARAVTEWARCVRANHWPSYGEGINQLSVPGWALTREEAA